MKNMMKLAAIMTAIAMMAGCSTGSSTAATEAAESAAETEAAAAETAAEETEAGETAAEAETEEEFDIDLSAGFDENGNVENVTASDYLVLPDYKNVVLAKADVDVPDEEVQAYIEENILSNYQETNQITDRAIVDGDTVNIDYVGSIDGVEFEGGSTQGNGTDVTIGVTSYIDDFLEQLIGHKAGDTFDINVTFPEEYSSNPDLSGKDAVFVTTVNYISENVTPELTDAWVAENLKDAYECVTVADVQDKVRDYLSTNKNSDAVWKWLLENTEFTKENEDLIGKLLDNYIETNKMYANYYGATFEEYLKAYGIESEEAMREEYRDSAVEYSHRYMIAQAISDAEQVEVTDDVVSEYFGGSDYSSYISTYGEGYVRMQVRINSVYQKIMETAQIK